MADEQKPKPRLIVTAPLADEHLWAEVLNLDGFDVLAQPFRPDEVKRVIESAWWSYHNHRKSAAGKWAKAAN
jgi:hypothetical protein